MARSPVVLAGLCVLTLAIYAPMRAAPFHYEDVHWLETLESPITWRIPGRGLTAQSYRVPQGSIVDPAVYHAGNVAIHLVNGVLVYGVAASVTSPPAALVAAGLFLLHPLNSQAVSYVAARSDLLLTGCVLLALWLALQGGWRLYLSLVPLVGAALSKEIGLIGIPLVLWTLLVWRRESLRASIPMAAGLWVLLGLICGLAWLPLTQWFTLEPGVGGSSYAWPTFAGLQLSAVWHLLSLLVPWNGYSIDHDILALGPVWMLMAGLCTVQAGIVAIAAWRRAPLASWAIGWVVLSVLPRFLFVTNEFVTEPQMYLALTGVSIGLGAGVAWLWSSRPVLAWRIAV